MAMMKYRKKIIKDDSKRNLLTRIEKRERFLAYAYCRGIFIKSTTVTCIKDQRKIKLKLDSDVNNPLDKAMIEILDEVDWFWRTGAGKEYVIYSNVPGKKYMRFLKKRVYLTRSKGFLYLYSPVTFFAWLSRKDTIFFDYGVKIPIYKTDVVLCQDWCKTLFELQNVSFENINNDSNKCYLVIQNEDLTNILNRIDKDKTVGKYSYLIYSKFENVLAKENKHG